MKLSLNRPLCVFDIEATGLDVTNDRIVEIAMLKINVDGSTSEYIQRVNPTIPIPLESSEIHGIYDKDIANEPTFQEIVKVLVDFIGDADLAGYNSNKFDIPMLAEELLRAKCDFDVSNRKFVDVQNIFHKMEQRTLVAAYAFYCNKDLTNAHNAMADTLATWEVLKAQVERYENIEPTVDFLSHFSQGGNFELLDFAGRLAVNDKGEGMYNFGKHKGRTIREVARVEPGYYGWMLDANFPLYTKQMLKKEMDKIKAEGDAEHSKGAKSKDITIDQLEALKNKFK